MLELGTGNWGAGSSEDYDLLELLYQLAVPVVQSVEQGTSDPHGPGSSPGWSSFSIYMLG